MNVTDACWSSNRSDRLADTALWHYSRQYRNYTAKMHTPCCQKKRLLAPDAICLSNRLTCSLPSLSAGVPAQRLASHTEPGLTSCLSKDVLTRRPPQGGFHACLGECTRLAWLKLCTLRAELSSEPICCANIIGCTKFISQQGRCAMDLTCAVSLQVQVKDIGRGHGQMMARQKHTTLGKKKGAVESAELLAAKQYLKTLCSLPGFSHATS